MTLCPIAIVAGCQKCPAFKICPLKGLVGDKPPAPEAAAPAASAGRKAARKPRRAAAKSK